MAVPDRRLTRMPPRARRTEAHAERAGGSGMAEQPREGNDFRAPSKRGIEQALRAPACDVRSACARAVRRKFRDRIRRLWHFDLAAPDLAIDGLLQFVHRVR